MSLATGTRLGPYEILGMLGAGGMGEVYRARDTRLDRTVAIKVVPQAASGDPERRARFEREARTIAGLSHPHICTLYDVGEHEGGLFLVMEHLAGQTLAERLERGALPLEEALRIAIEIADALSAAHRNHIVHRDLKPANVMLARSGGGRHGPPVAKLLDFGVARLTESAAPGEGSTTISRTGALVGTVPYMAPEQVEGRATDARTDLFALGAVVYEMLTGRRAFEGETPTSVMAAVLEREPVPLSERQPRVPPALDRLIRRCLAKNPDDRWDSAHDIADELRWIASETRTPTLSSERRRRWPVWAPWSIAVLLLVALVVGSLVAWQRASRPTAHAQAPRRYYIDIEPAEALGGPDPREKAFYGGRPVRRALAVSPDGRQLVFAAREKTRQGLYVRDLEHGEVRPIPGTDGGEAPEFSPDGRSVAFWSGGALRKVDVETGMATIICRTGETFGVSWSDDGNLVFATLSGPLRSVPASGGTPSTATDLRAGEVSHAGPHVLAGGEWVLYTAYSPSDDPGVWVESLRTRERRKVALDQSPGSVSDTRFVASGHLLYGRHGKLEAVPFDPGRLEVTGPAVVVIADVMQSAGADSADVNTGELQLTISRDGSLYYLPGGTFPRASSTLVWRDWTGRRRALRSFPQLVDHVRIAPDGRRLAITLELPWERPNDEYQAVVIYDLETGITSGLREGSNCGFPVWRPDGKALALACSERGGRANIFTVAADGGSAPARLTTSPLQQFAHGWTPSLDTVVFTEKPDVVHEDIWRATVDTKRLEPLLRSEAREMAPALSHDGRWLAYTSGVPMPGGHPDADFRVFVRAYDGPSGDTQVSLERGYHAAWAPDGRTLFYSQPRFDLGPRGKAMMAVEMIDGRPAPGRPQRELFADTWSGVVSVRGWDLAPDGKRFLMIEDVPPPAAAVSRINVVLNFFEELKAAAPPP